MKNQSTNPNKYSFYVLPSKSNSYFQTGRLSKEIMKSGKNFVALLWHTRAFLSFLPENE